MANKHKQIHYTINSNCYIKSLWSYNGYKDYLRKQTLGVYTLFITAIIYLNKFKGNIITLKFRIPI